MFEYNYERELIDNIYNINNINRVDEYGYIINLVKEINSSSIGKCCNIKCNNGSVTISFCEELTTEEQSTLDTIVFNHKNNL